MARFTDEQRRAIETTDRSLLVSAAAGSGKTSVLAERCARLVCEPVEGKPCEVSELLVVTFTEAAAAEMRSRIGDALRKRLADGSRTQHIEEQLALLPSAPISTIHSFCFDLIRRWFTRAGIDPQAGILDADEAGLLQHETLESLFAALYGQASDNARAFERLVEDDYHGNDAGLLELILAMYGFVRSLPEGTRWLTSGAYRFATTDAKALAELVHETRQRRLTAELRKQREWVAKALTGWSPEALAQISQLHALQQYGLDLDDWLKRAETVRTAAELDSLTARIRQTDGKTTTRTSSKAKVTAEEKARAKTLHGRMRGKLLGERLHEDRAAFTAAQCLDGLARVRDKQQVIVRLIEEFDARYRQAKQAENVLDFTDLEQKAFAILSHDGDPSKPSDVARRCHAQYRHVLVDEFQDVNPLQAAVLRLASREASGETGVTHNLFTVGDVKQSIYAFRLAAPQLFTERARRFADDKLGTLIPLSRNFRSRPGVINAVNAVFERCMTQEFGDVAYDESAQLKQGLVFPATEGRDTFAATTAELHLLSLPKKPTQQPHHPDAAATATTDGAEPPEGEPAAAEPSAEDDAPDDIFELHRVEREAHLIATRIREFMGLDGHTRRQVCRGTDPETGQPRYQPLEYRHIVILLRSMTNKADRLAATLHQMGVPVRADIRSGYFETSELRDMLALLSLLDNQKQDIPLAAVLRSPLARPGPFTADDLVRIQRHAPDAPFHEAAATYANDGPDADLRERLKSFWAAISRMRTAARRRSLADVVWEIYESTGYLAYVGGLPHGQQRRANLVGLHDRARQFGTFRKQGLRRFLRFIEQLRRQEEDLAPPSAASEADDVVRVLSVHQSKGLEFPVVFVADLGGGFNVSDIGRPVVLHRDEGIGMKVVDPEKRIVYPSLAHQVVAEAKHREILAEELRIQYVAMTRAREHLVLVGSDTEDNIAKNLDAPSAGEAGPVDLLTLETARKPLDWVLAALRRMPAAQRPHGLEPVTRDAVFAVYHHDVDAITGWELPERTPKARRDRLAEVAQLAPLPDDEPMDAKDAEVREVVERLAYEYPATALTTMPARKAVTELKQAFDPLAEADDRPRERPAGRILEMPRFAADTAASPAARGTATHRFLQCLDLKAPPDEASLKRQLAEMVRRGQLEADAESVVDTAAAAWFLGTDLGQKVRAAADSVQREVMFVSSVSPETVEPGIAPVDARDGILIRGMIDVLLPTPDGIEILDYKTDAVEGAALAERASLYKTQIDVYAKAVQGIWRRNVTARWLIFLAARQIVSA